MGRTGKQSNIAPLHGILDRIGTLILVGGVSGAGRSAAVDTLADLGFFTVENLPVPLFQSFLLFLGQSGEKFTKTALSLDIDSRLKQAQLLSILEKYTPRPPSLQVIFLDCAKEVIIKRYGQTRRPHPGFSTQKDKTIEDTILREKNRLFPLKQIANLVIDSSNLNIHDLRREVRAFVESLPSSKKQPMRVNFISFGFKHGIPPDCDLVVDVRFLPNPHFVDTLRDRSGLDKKVVQYVFGQQNAKQFVERYLKLLHFLVPHYFKAGKLYLNVGIGCTGGKHRSVAIAERLASVLQNKLNETRYLFSLKHRDIELPQ